jgi:hypothetical protein
MCVELRLDGESINRPVSEVWEKLIVEDLPTLVDEVSSKIGLSIPTTLPKSNAATLCYRLIAAVLGINAMGRIAWTCESAAIDSSGPAGSLVLSYAEKFPALSAFLREVPSESRFQRAASCWIIKKDQQPLMCLREDGQGEKTGGGSFDFSARYKSERRLFMIAQELLGKEFDL